MYIIIYGERYFQIIYSIISIYIYYIYGTYILFLNEVVQGNESYGQRKLF